MATIGINSDEGEASTNYQFSDAISGPEVEGPANIGGTCPEETAQSTAEKTSQSTAEETAQSTANNDVRGFVIVGDNLDKILDRVTSEKIDKPNPYTFFIPVQLRTV